MVDTAGIAGTINTGIGYAKDGLHFVRDILTKIVSWIPGIDPTLATMIIFLLFSFWLGGIITKKFTTTPWSMAYIIYTLIISVSLFLNLMFL